MSVRSTPFTPPAEPSQTPMTAKRVIGDIALTLGSALVQPLAMLPALVMATVNKIR